MNRSSQSLDRSVMTATIEDARGIVSNMLRRSCRTVGKSALSRFRPDRAVSGEVHLASQVFDDIEQMANRLGRVIQANNDEHIASAEIH